MANQPNVVILGAGFVGMGAMKKLKKAPVEVTIIDKNNYHTFQPLLYQVATAELSRNEVGYPIRDMLRGHGNWVFHQAEVTSIDLANRRVICDGLEPIPYDYLIVGLGAVVNVFGTKGAAEHALPLYTLNDADKLRKHILERFEAVDRNPSLVDDGALTFCIVGGGATGVETAGALSELIHAELRSDYPNLPIDKAQVHLYEHGPHLLAPFKPKLQEYALKELQERNVNVHLGERVVEVEPRRVVVKPDGALNAHTLIWGAGLTSNPITETLGADLERGRVPVGSDLRLKDHQEVFVAGDMAMITDAKTGTKLPQLGSVALQSGTHAAENIVRLVKGEKTKPFEYEDKGTMATIGRGSAVVQLHSGRGMTGHAAWVAWLGVHMTLLTGGEERTHTIVDWGWSLLTHERGKRIVID